MRLVSYSACVMFVLRNKGVTLQQQPLKPDINCNYIHPATNLIFSIFLYIIYSSI